MSSNTIQRTLRPIQTGRDCVFKHPTQPIDASIEHYCPVDCQLN